LLVKTAHRDPAAWLTLNRPAQHNCLDTALIDALRSSLQSLRNTDHTAVVITGAGRSFSTGGDLRALLERADHPDALADYARRLVEGLNEIILALVASPVPVIACINGPVTGGALGLVLAADLAVMAQGSFLQPWYVEMGFAPDGGWTALLPERIGTARALAIQLLNSRVDAEEALRLGLVHDVAPRTRLVDAVDRHVAALNARDACSIRTTRSLIHDPARLSQLRTRLAAEADAFVRLVTRPEACERMRRWIGDRGTARTNKVRPVRQ